MFKLTEVAFWRVGNHSHRGNVCAEYDCSAAASCSNAFVRSRILAHIQSATAGAWRPFATRGSLPIRTGVDASGYNACAAAGASAIEKGNSVAALMIPFSPEKVGALGAELKVLWAKPDAKPDDYVTAVAGVLEKY